MFDRATAGVEPDAEVIAAMERQPEFTLAIRDYMARLLDARRIDEGREKLAQWQSVLAAIERDYGVDRHVVVSIWGIESAYGRITGRRPLVRSLATVSCHGKRQRFFRGELMATLRILAAGDIPAENLRGSWAGAFGQTQFMPTTFRRVAVDFDGDGRRDIVGSVPDALASTANYLREAGWRTQEPWGYEVRLPADYDGPSGRRERRPLATFRDLGVRRIGGGELDGPETAALLLPAGARGPAFVVFRNFDAIHAYNPADAYALAIAHLSDRLRGGPAIVAAWPGEAALTPEEKREVQERLAARGYDVGEVDGIIGPRTAAAIKAYQRDAGVTPDGHAGPRVLQALRRAARTRP